MQGTKHLTTHTILFTIPHARPLPGNDELALLRAQIEGAQADRLALVARAEAAEGEAREVRARLREAEGKVAELEEFMSEVRLYLFFFPFIPKLSIL